jgi:hypothetical protein
MIVNQTEAQRFLKLLDPEATSFTFQTFDDKASKRPELARVIHSPAFPDLLKLHDDGAGVFVAVNATDGAGRKAKTLPAFAASFRTTMTGLAARSRLSRRLLPNHLRGAFSGTGSSRMFGSRTHRGAPTSTASWSA